MRRIVGKKQAPVHLRRSWRYRLPKGSSRLAVRRTHRARTERNARRAHSSSVGRGPTLLDIALAARHLPVGDLHHHTHERRLRADGLEASRSQTFCAAAQTVDALWPVASARRHSRSAGSIGGGGPDGGAGGGIGGGAARSGGARGGSGGNVEHGQMRRTKMQLPVHSASQLAVAGFGVLSGNTGQYGMAVRWY